MSEILKPCPFCGGSNLDVVDTPQGYFIGCSCGCFTGDFETREAAIDAWNTRAERTCHDDGGTDQNGQQVFNCSNCGCVLSLFDSDGLNTICTSHIYDYPRYCPNCGAKVVKHD